MPRQDTSSAYNPSTTGLLDWGFLLLRGLQHVQQYEFDEFVAGKWIPGSQDRAGGATLGAKSVIRYTQLQGASLRGSRPLYARS